MVTLRLTGGLAALCAFAVMLPATAVTAKITVITFAFDFKIHLLKKKLDE